jgi:tRNA pseudouridine38-40 synthase
MFRAECVVNAVQPECFSFYFSGDGFLRRMVRNLAGTLFMVGAHRIDFNEFKAILAGRDRQLAGPTAPAHGLFLIQVHFENTPDIPEPWL